jgi:hypothetical protein
MVETPYPRPKYGPLNGTQQGLVAYSTDGSYASIESGKFSAYRLMQNACSGPYEILGHVPNREPPLSMVQNAEALTTSKHYIRFECRPHARRYTRNPDPQAW